MKLEKRKVLVTGGTAGIGAALTELLLQQGCEVIVCGRQKDALATLSERQGVFPIYTDLANPDDVQRLASEINALHPDLSVIFNNAGLQTEFEISKTPVNDAIDIAQRETQINFLAPLALIALLLQNLARQPQAIIVNITSPLAFSPKKSSPVYCATKAALRSYTRSLRFQLAEIHPNIQVIEAQPPLVDTAMTQGRGKGKITPQAAALGILQGVEKSQREIYVGKAKLMYFISRWAPSIAEQITKRW
jgi:uncharacterized oxidoreductase